MAGAIVLQDGLIGKDWEEALYREGCARMRQEARERLEALEAWLHGQAPPDWQVVGFRERTVVCRFGEVTVRRRLYRDGGGRYHFLLDEYLGWEPRQIATPSLQEAMVAVAARSSFREAAMVVEHLTAGVVSVMTVQRSVQRVGERVVEWERGEVEACFERGEVPEAGGRVVPWLFVEADGLYVRLQRAREGYLEIRTAIGYEGWKRLAGAGDRHRLVGKRVYAQADEGIDFWEGVSVAFGRVWDWSRIGLVVMNGDGAGWIDEGAELLGRAVRQLDGFHLARSCYQAGGEMGPTLYEAIRRGEWAEGSRLLEQVRPGKGGRSAWEWAKKVIEERRGADWRVQVGLEKGEGRGLGAMEGNEAQVWARRLKGKGMSWSPQGARNMAKVLELVTNGEVKQWCGRPTAGQGPQPKPKPKRTNRQKKDPTEWLQAGMPVLYGPDASKPWVRSLRHQVHLYHLLN